MAGGRLVKTRQFSSPHYIGDPVNTIHIFNTLRAEEIFLLDIRATVEGRDPDYGLLAQQARFVSVPFGYGGGIRTLDQVRRVLAAGCEKVVVNSAATDPAFVTAAARLTGSQAIVVSVDVRRDPDGMARPYVRSGSHALNESATTFARRMVDAGAGELLLHSIDRDGSMQGYDVPLVQEVATAVSVPVIAVGGARTRDDLAAVIKQGGAQAAAAGALFFYQKATNRNVLVNYPELHIRRSLMR